MPIGRGSFYATVLACILQFLSPRQSCTPAPPRSAFSPLQVSPCFVQPRRRPHMPDARPRRVLFAEPPSGVPLAPSLAAGSDTLALPWGVGQPGTPSRCCTPPLVGVLGMAKDATCTRPREMVWGAAPLYLGEKYLWT